ncbi:2-hydroxyacid dehydrogenase [Formicincola oecophyllae]|uniref:2-hydroxyacid dehydrogenase n=1 Tax=Formicincola oecophyllae TaxID=2558361 RepID=A0A4Y6U9J7_9PROT|nr:2-hydroxyacid dehydrogenase [Formicincola oecophyllae]QDH13126.1 2-hydroxyacid dehydrogenase [Formicincola oecophyllae]
MTTPIPNPQGQPGLLLLGTVWPEKAVEAFRQFFAVHRFEKMADLNQAALAQIGPGIKAVATGFVPGLPGPVMAALPALQAIAVDGVGTDLVDMAQAHKRGIAVMTEAGAPIITHDVADMAMALLLAVKRRVVFNNQWVRSGDWAAKGLPPLGSSLSGCKMGLAGFGHIGQAIARRAAAAEMTIAYWQRHQVPQSPHPFMATLLELAQWADVLVLAMPATAATRGIVNGAVLEALGEQGVLINIARGALVDEQALIAALAGGRLAGAGLDVFDHEPAINPAFLMLQNTVLSPHQASATFKDRLDTALDCLGKLKAFFKLG